MQVKASLRSLPHAQAKLQDAEAACFASHRLWLQQNSPDSTQSEATLSGSAKHNARALQALQMLLLLLEFSAYPK